MSEKATTEDKRLLLSYVFSNLGLNADRIRTNYTFAFDFLTNWVPKLNYAFEPAKTPMNKRKNRAFDPAFIPVLGGKDSNLGYLIQSQMSSH